MPTILQERLADEIVKGAMKKKGMTKGKLLRSVGYARKHSEVRPGEIMEAKGLKMALKERGFTEEAAKETVSAILSGKKTKDDTKLRAADMIFRCFGSYAAEKQVIATANVSLTELFSLAAQQSQKQENAQAETV
jgi:hypothetical protein